MQPTITVDLSAGRSVAFTATNGRVQVIAEGASSIRGIGEAKKAALQKLADATGTAYEYYEPAVIPPIQAGIIKPG